MSRFFTPSMGVACLALAVALSGTAYAVTRLPINSVGTKQVINHSLQGVDFKRGTLLRGPVGQRGPQGPQGAKGATGSAGSAGLPVNGVSFRSKGAGIAPTAGTDSSVIISCPDGTQILYGGFTTSVPVYVLANYGNQSDWTVRLRSTGVEGAMMVYTACVKTP